MDPHLLRTYVTVARLRSFSAAARALGYTQSAVSQHIAALEQDLGLPLLGRRPVVPTPAGVRLLEHAGSLLLRIDAARADLAGYAAAPREELTVAASPLAVHPAALAALPPTGVTLRVLPRDEVPAAVATGGADLGLVDGIAAPSDPLALPDVAPLIAAPLPGAAAEPLVVVVPDGHPLARRAGLRLADLADARWLDAPAAGPPLDRLRAAVGAPGGFRPSLRYEGTDVRTLLALAAAGHGLVLLPAAAARSADAAAVPLVAPRLVHRTELLRPGGVPARPAARVLDALTAAPQGS